MRHRVVTGSRPRFVRAWIVVALVAGATAAWADPEFACQFGRTKAAGKYARCIQDALAKVYAGRSFTTDQLNSLLETCVKKYGVAYDRLRAAAQASPATETCDAPRFVDNGDGTVTDNLTALVWEQKTDDSTIHDKDNNYTWSVTSADPDGTAYTVLLATLNGAGFAGKYDWRLPTLGELLSIYQPACASGPCLDPTLATIAGFAEYWSSSTTSYNTHQAWLVGRADDSLALPKSAFLPVRAVRGSPPA
jgi:uncharacterized protein DUF1566